MARHWTAEQTSELVRRFRETTDTHAQIAAHINTSEKAVQGKLRELRRKHGADYLPDRKRGPNDKTIDGKAFPRPWSAEDNATLIACGDKGRDFAVIAALLKRTPWACKVKYHALKRSGSSVSVGAQREHEQAVAARALALRREAGNARQTLTAMIFGDPLPGRSALDAYRAAGRDI